MARDPIPYFYREAELAQRLGIGRTQLRAKSDPESPYYDPRFPAPVQLGLRTIAYSVERVEWYIDQIAGRAML